MSISIDVDVNYKLITVDHFGDECVMEWAVIQYAGRSVEALKTQCSFHIAVFPMYWLYGVYRILHSN